MGLHPDVKKFLRTRFPSSVGDGVPASQCDVLVCDHMWLLFKFRPEDGATGEDLVDFVWRPMLRFFRAGGTSYACVFDVPERVPVAKAEEHRRRYDRGGLPSKNPRERVRRRLSLFPGTPRSRTDARGRTCARTSREA